MVQAAAVDIVVHHGSWDSPISRVKQTDLSVFMSFKSKFNFFFFSDFVPDLLLHHYIP